MGAKQEKIKIVKEDGWQLFNCQFFFCCILPKCKYQKWSFLKNAHRARKGVWGFPQSVKSQKSVCRVSANWLIDLFIFASGAPLATLARVKVGLA